MQLEERFLAVSRRAELPQPVANEWVKTEAGDVQVDFAWRDLRLVVETDGRRYHTDEWSFEEDRRRDAELKLAGWEVQRFTWRQLVDKLEWVLRTLRRLIARQRSNPTMAPPNDGRRR